MTKSSKNQVPIPLNSGTKKAQGKKSKTGASFGERFFTFDLKFWIYLELGIWFLELFFGYWLLLVFNFIYGNASNSR